MNIKIIIGIATIIAVLAIIIGFFFKNPKNEEAIVPPLIQPTKVIVINDSVKVWAQDVKLANSKKTIELLMDSIQKLTLKPSGIDPEILLQFKQVSEYKNKVGKYQDSLSSLIDSLIKYKNTPAYTDLIKNKKFKYVIEDKWFEQKGNFDLQGNINIETLKVKDAPYVVFGDKGKWFQRKTIQALVGNKNPNVNVDSLQSFVYIPKDKMQISAGPIILTNGINTTVGAGITLKKKFISITIGYQFKNK